MTENFSKLKKAKSSQIEKAHIVPNRMDLEKKKKKTRHIIE